MENKKKIVVCGTGRAGTTFIMQILTEMGYDTGLKSMDDDFRESVRAGQEIPYPVGINFNKNLELEWTMSFHEAKTRLEQTPYIIKSPNFSNHLSELIKNNIIEVEHVIIPIRNIQHVAESRVKVDLEMTSDFFPNIENKISRQKTVAYMMLGRLVEAINLYDLKYTFIKFPEMVYTADYLLDKLKNVFPDIKGELFYQIFHKVSKKELITIQ